MSHAVAAQLVIDAPLDTVWDAWTSPDHLSRWYPDRVEGEFIVGHHVRLHWDCFGFDIDLEVLDVLEHERLVVRGNLGVGVSQTQDVHFAGDGDRTLLNISHDGLLTDDQRDGTTAAWRTIAAVLQTYVGRYFGRDRITFASLGPARVSFDRLFEHFTHAERLAGWLGTGSGIGNTGDAIDIELHSGARLRGSVLARSEPREIAIACDDLEAVIAFRAFPLPGITRDEKLVGVWASVWNDDPAVAGALEAGMITAVDKLVTILQW